MVTLSEAVIRDIFDPFPGKYAFYARPAGAQPLVLANQAVFRSASIIKIPILLAWLHLERLGLVQRSQLGDLESEPQVQGAGLSWLLKTRRLPFQDILLLMIALSDNLCTNLVIRQIGLERLDQVLHGPLELSPHTRVERRLMDYAARERGLDNTIAAADIPRLFSLVRGLPPAELSWVQELLAACVDSSLFLRDIPRDSLTFYHKTGSMPGVLHDWGYTGQVELCLLTQDIPNEDQANSLFAQLGRLFLDPQN